MPQKPKTKDSSLADSFQGLLINKELLFKVLDVLPITIEIFAPDGTTVFFNKAGLDLNSIADPSLVIGKYNLLSDPVCNDQMNMREGIQKAFRGEPAVFLNVNAPIDDLVERGVVKEKPYEKSCMDFYLHPIMDNGKLAFVVFVCIVKGLYQGRPEVAKAKEYLDNQWLEEYEPKKLAEAVGMSVKQIYTLFKHHTGLTPGNYYKHIKIERIKEKLNDKTLPIKEAFAACGVDDRGAYRRVFREITGLTPSEYRANLQQLPPYLQ